MGSKHFMLIATISLVSVLLFLWGGCTSVDTSNNQPVCSISSPADGAEFIKGQEISISVNASDPDVPLDTLTVLIYLDEINLASLVETPYNLFTQYGE